MNDTPGGRPIELTDGLLYRRRRCGRILTVDRCPGKLDVGPRTGAYSDVSRLALRILAHALLRGSDIRQHDLPRAWITDEVAILTYPA